MWECRSRSSLPALILMIAWAAAGASRTVWEGVYSAEQAGRGQKAYNAQCARCHGEALLGGETAPALVDRDFLETWEGNSVGSLVEAIRVTMPSDGPGKLSRQQAADIVAYLLKSNRFPEGKSDMATDIAALNQIVFGAKP